MYCRLCRSDGLLLKPGRPVTAIDAQIKQQAFGGAVGPQGEVYFSRYVISGIEFGVVFASELAKDYMFTAADAKIPVGYILPFRLPMYPFLTFYFNRMPFGLKWTPWIHPSL